MAARGKEGKLRPEMIRIVEEQRKRFAKKFGRPAGPDDPVFFDPHAPTPKEIDGQEIHREMLKALFSAGIPPHFIYAFQKTGMLVTEMNRDCWTEGDLEKWNRAIEEYLAMEAEQEGKPKQ